MRKERMFKFRLSLGMCLLVASFFWSEEAYSQSYLLHIKTETPQEKAALNWFWQGEKLSLQQKYSKAIESYNYILREYPNLDIVPTIRYRIAEITLSHIDKEKALVQYEYLVTNYPLSIEAAYALNKIKKIYASKNQPFDLGGRQEALLALYETTIKEDPNPAHVSKAYFAKGFILGWQGKKDERELIYTKLKTKFPSSEEAAHVSFLAADRRGESIKEKIKLLADVLNDYPNSSIAPFVQNLIGLYYLYEKQQDLALAAFNNAVKKYPASYYTPRALLEISKIYQDRNDNLKAKEALQDIIDNFSQAPESLEAQRLLNNAPR